MLKNTSNASKKNIDLLLLMGIIKRWEKLYQFFHKPSSFYLSKETLNILNRFCLSRPLIFIFCEFKLYFRYIFFVTLFPYLQIPPCQSPRHHRRHRVQILLQSGGKAKITEQYSNHHSFVHSLMFHFLLAEYGFKR